MHAVQLVAFEESLVDASVPDPEPGPREVLVDVRACGICHSDAHYRAGTSSLSLPRTLGHEVAGVVLACGEGVVGLAEGDRVAIHYLKSCGTCDRCRRSGEQFCVRGEMIGKECDGGYAERIVVPARNAIRVPDNVPIEHAAVMMCSTATAYHALRLADLAPGETVALIGFGGLGVSALELARAMGASTILAVDVIREKLDLAERSGAVPIDAFTGNVEEKLAEATDGHGVDVALDFAGRATAAASALRSLAPGGRLMMVALASKGFDFDPYRDLIVREARIAGCSDHLTEELVGLMGLASDGRIDIAKAITRTVPLDAARVDEVLDDLDRGTSHLRTVIVRE